MLVDREVIFAAGVLSMVAKRGEDLLCVRKEVGGRGGRPRKGNFREDSKILDWRRWNQGLCLDVFVSLEV